MMGPISEECTDSLRLLNFKSNSRVYGGQSDSHRLLMNQLPIFHQSAFTNETSFGGNTVQFLGQCFGRALVHWLAVTLTISLVVAKESRAETAKISEELPPNIKRLIRHGRILARPAAQPEGTSLEV